RSKPEERFSKDVPDWHKYDLFADAMTARVGWGVVYVLLHILCIQVWELPGTHWWMYFLLPIHFMMGPVHGAIVNWSGHKYGYAIFDSNDKSKNSLLMDFQMLGEPFQNIHHWLPKRAIFVVKWSEFDTTYPLVKLMPVTGIIKLK